LALGLAGVGVSLRLRLVCLGSKSHDRWSRDDGFFVDGPLRLFEGIAVLQRPGYGVGPDQAYSSGMVGGVEQSHDPGLPVVIRPTTPLQDSSDRQIRRSDTPRHFPSIVLAMHCDSPLQKSRLIIPSACVLANRPAAGAAQGTTTVGGHARLQAPPNKVVWRPVLSVCFRPDIPGKRCVLCDKSEFPDVCAPTISGRF